jgi:hypothetical protein
MRQVTLSQFKVSTAVRWGLFNFTFVDLIVYFLSIRVCLTDTRKLDFTPYEALKCLETLFSKDTAIEYWKNRRVQILQYVPKASWSNLPSSHGVTCM